MGSIVATACCSVKLSLLHNSGREEVEWGSREGRRWMTSKATRVASSSLPFQTAGGSLKQLSEATLAETSLFLAEDCAKSSRGKDSFCIWHRRNSSFLGESFLEEETVFGISVDFPSGGHKQLNELLPSNGRNVRHLCTRKDGFLLSRCPYRENAGLVKEAIVCDWRPWMRGECLPNKACPVIVQDDITDFAWIGFSSVEFDAPLFEKLPPLANLFQHIQVLHHQVIQHIYCLPQTPTECTCAQLKTCPDPLIALSLKLKRKDDVAQRSRSHNNITSLKRWCGQEYRCPSEHIRSGLRTALTNKTIESSCGGSTSWLALLHQKPQHQSHPSTRPGTCQDVYNSRVTSLYHLFMITQSCGLGEIPASPPSHDINEP